jgi:hypothetical protein
MTFQGLNIGFHHWGKDRGGTIPPLEFVHAIECKIAPPPPPPPGIGLQQDYPRLSSRNACESFKFGVMKL